MPSRAGPSRGELKPAAKAVAPTGPSLREEGRDGVGLEGAQADQPVEPGPTGLEMRCRTVAVEDLRNARATVDPVRLVAV